VCSERGAERKKKRRRRKSIKALCWRSLIRKKKKKKEQKKKEKRRDRLLEDAQKKKKKGGKKGVDPVESFLQGKEEEKGKPSACEYNPPFSAISEGQSSPPPKERKKKKKMVGHIKTSLPLMLWIKGKPSNESSCGVPEG